jgi:hypothetical protein
LPSFAIALKGPRAACSDRVKSARSRRVSSLFDLEALPERAFVDYLIAAESRFGVFVLGFDDDP